MMPRLSARKSAGRHGDILIFESPLTQEQADNYELIAPDVGCTGCVNETASRDMDCCWNCSRNRRSKKDLYRRRPAGGMQS